MAAVEFTFDKFVEKLKSGQYETSTAARRGVGKVLWSDAKKDEARGLIDKHFGGGAKPAKAAKLEKSAKLEKASKAAKVADKPKGKPGRKPKAETVEAAPKVKGKPGPKPGAKKAEKPAKVVAPSAEPKKRGRPAGSGKKAVTAPAAAKAVLADLGTVAFTEGGLSEYALKLIELAISEQNALSSILAAVPAARDAFAINAEEIQSNLDLYAQLTRRIDALLGPALDEAIAGAAPPAPKTAGPKAIKAEKPVKVVKAEIDPVPVAAEGDDDVDLEDEPPASVDTSAPTNGAADEESRRTALWSGALPIAQSLGRRDLLPPEQFK